MFSVSYVLSQNLLGTQRVSNPATRKDLTARSWGVFWYESKIRVLFGLMVQIKQKRGTGVENSPPRSFWCDCVQHMRKYRGISVHHRVSQPIHMSCCLSSVSRRRVCRRISVDHRALELIWGGYGQ